MCGWRAVGNLAWKSEKPKITLEELHAIVRQGDHLHPKPLKPKPWFFAGQFLLDVLKAHEGYMV